MEQTKKLLELISIISKKNTEMLDVTGVRFNIFRVCGVNRDENKHSNILAEFLNPAGSHGLNSKLLE
ncbi:MAG: PD-(D/E)XK nuclease family protein, partial [Tannerellaceae bacterium]|nr:PD-(D/E)XK nuclease family protein [Tannerellaceae bacterium]